MKHFYNLLFLFGIIGLCSCMNTDNLLSNFSLQVSIPNNQSEYHWVKDAKRVFFFIRNGDISTEVFDSSTSDFNLSVEKTQNIPVLSCVLFNDDTINLYDCNAALGGTYPFDAYNHVLQLKPLHYADTAQLLLSLSTQQVNIAMINIHKLYDTIEKKSPNTPIDTDKFFEYLTKNTLSYWGITSKESIDVTLPSITQEWLSCNGWANHISPGTDTITLYQGKWRFVQKDSPNTYAFIYIDKNQKVLLHGFH